MKQEAEIIIFTDGSSRGNPGSGGFGAILVIPVSDKEIHDLRFMIYELGGREKHTTNNRMEIQAAISALSYVQMLHATRYTLCIYTDSSYLLNGITKWVFGWQKNGWKTATKQAVENQDLWEQLLVVTSGKEIDWRLVKGHVGVAGNQRCDEIATAFADGKKPKLYSGVLENYGIKNILDTSSNSKSVTKSKESKARSRAKAFSYVSSLNGKVKVHQTWAECEARVKGQSGAKFKKALDKDDEGRLIKDWS